MQSAIQNVASDESDTPQVPVKHRPIAARVAATTLFLLIVILAVQWLTGAWIAEFDSHPDESGHYVTGVMARSYLLNGHFTNPVGYAQEFYSHYPRVAIGHWPPVFPGLQGAWMAVFGTSRAAIMILIAIIGALFGLMTFLAGCKVLSPGAALFASTLLLLTPLITTAVGSVMGDVLVGLLCLLAAMSFAQFMDTLRRRDALLFGLWASIAIMTKGNALALALLPAVAIALRRQWRLLLHPSLWAAGMLVIALCGPWYVLVANRGGMESTPGLAFTTHALWYYTVAGLNLFGVVLVPFILCGAWTRMVVPAWRGAIDSFWASAASLVVSVYLFHLIVPIGYEPRYWIPAMPALALLLTAGAIDVGKVLQAAVRGFRQPRLVLAAVGVIFMAVVFRLPTQTATGFADTARAIIANPQWRNSVILVTSSISGSEGALVSEMAMRSDLGERFVLRATKMLSSADIFGRNYRSFYETPGALMAFCRQVPVGLMVVDTRAHPTRRRLHYELVQQMLHDYASQWKLVGQFPSGSAHPHILLYDQIGHQKLPRNPFSIDLTDKIGRKLTAQ